jgi:hypothetical protein
MVILMKRLVVEVRQGRFFRLPPQPLKHIPLIIVGATFAGLGYSSESGTASPLYSQRMRFLHLLHFGYLQG